MTTLEKMTLRATAASGGHAHVEPARAVQGSHTLLRGRLEVFAIPRNGACIVDGSLTFVGMHGKSGLGGLVGLRWRDGLVAAVRGFVILLPVALIIGFIAKALTEAVDHPVFDAIRSAGTNDWTDVLSTLTRMGNVPQTQRLAAVLAIALAVWFWRRGERWWMPLLVLPASWIVSRIFQFGIAWIVDRDRDATSLLGTTVGAFPSGGVMRITIVSATAVFLAAHYGGLSKRTINLGYILAALLGLAEAYFRTRLNQHWLTDVISGLIIAPLFVVVVVRTLRAFDPRPSPTHGPDTAADGASISEGKTAVSSHTTT